MNALLFERSSGNLGPDAFARIHTISLLRSFGPAPRLRFDGGERAPEPIVGAGRSTSSPVVNPARTDQSSRTSLWAHQAGVTALALERFDGRM